MNKIIFPMLEMKGGEIFISELELHEENLAVYERAKKLKYPLEYFMSSEVTFFKEVFHLKEFSFELRQRTWINDREYKRHRADLKIYIQDVILLEIKSLENFLERHQPYLFTYAKRTEYTGFGRRP